MGQFDDLEKVTPALTIGIVWYLDVSENNGTPKSSILIGFSIIDHPFWGTSIFGNTHLCSFLVSKKCCSNPEGWPVHCRSAEKSPGFIGSVQLGDHFDVCHRVDKLNDFFPDK